MPNYSTRSQHVPIGEHVYRLCVLSDKRQFQVPGGRSTYPGMSAARWSQFGHVWPCGLLLAQAMQRFDIAGKRILELGCGIGLASLVLQRRGADVIASDTHPLAEPLLARNAALNGLPAVQYRQLRWNEAAPTLGRFEVIIASDVLFEHGQALQLAGLVERHAARAAEIVVTDPGYQQRLDFTQLLAAQGFDWAEERCPMNDRDTPPYRGRLVHYTRSRQDLPT